MRTKIIAGNWKMNKVAAEAIAFARDLKVKTLNIRKTEIIVCPPFTVLAIVHDILKDSRAEVGAQNVHFASSGAYTGEISAEMIESAGCRHVIIGHSERRQYFGETNQLVNQKLIHVLTTSLTPIVCIGETLEQRQSGQTENVIRTQLEESLTGLTTDQLKRVVLAYEPVWAIGTGVTATPEQAEEVHKFIRELIRSRFGQKSADSIQILYGGSVKPDNIRDLLSRTDIDGGLIGGASLNVASFVEMIKITEDQIN
ncbi:triose-phosphate isomerase [candidate division KSB1 bacterium]|nr:triose-phosphate isomerase [candidate division KSB1 bacterium]